MENGYQKLYDRFIRIDPEDVRPVKSMSMSVFIQEAENLCRWMQADEGLLRKKGGLNSEFCSDELLLRIEALRVAESIWQEERLSPRPALKAWQEQSPRGFQLFRELIRTFRHAYRNDKDNLTSLKDLTPDYTPDTVLMYLPAFKSIAERAPEALKKIDFDFKLLDEAECLAQELSDVLADRDVEQEEGFKTKKIRDQAYTYLKQAVNEIRLCGRYVFHHDKERLVGYRSEALHRKNIRRNRKKQILTDAKPMNHSLAAVESSARDTQPSVEQHQAVDQYRPDCKGSPPKAPKKRNSKKRHNKKRRR